MATEASTTVVSAKMRTRTTVACLPCRLLKIRCIRSDDPSIATCENCRDSRKDCVFVPPSTTRRRKRTDVRVNELENKVRELASKLDDKLERRQYIHEDSAHANNEHHTSNLSLLPGFSFEAFSKSLPESAFPETEYVTPETVPRAPNTLANVAQQHEDLIDKGLLSWETALSLFHRYQTELQPRYPIVFVSERVDIGVFRRTYPVLFLAIITAAAATASEELRTALHESVLLKYAVLVMVDGTKSVELLQAMLVTVAWYRPCGSFNDTKYLQYTQAASLMAQELNLGRVVTDSMKNGGIHAKQITTTSLDFVEPAKLWASQQSEDHATSQQRTLLAAYFQSSSKAFLSSTKTLQFEISLIAAVITSFELSKPHKEYDFFLLTYAKIQATTQETLRSLQRMEAVSMEVSIENDSIQCIVSAFASEIDTLLDNINSHSQTSDFLKIAAHASILRIFEVSLYQDFNACDFRAPYQLDSSPKAGALGYGPPHVKAITICMNSCHTLLSTLSGLKLDALAGMPAVVFVRMMYALVVLYKIYLLVTSTTHPLYNMVSLKNLRLLEHLGNLKQLLFDLDDKLNFQGSNKYLSFVDAMENRCLALHITKPNDSLPSMDSAGLDEVVFENRSSHLFANPIEYPLSKGLSELSSEDIDAAISWCNDALLDDSS